MGTDAMRQVYSIGNHFLARKGLKPFNKDTPLPTPSTQLDREMAGQMFPIIISIPGT